MPTFDLTRGPRDRFDRRRNALLIVTPLVAGALVLAVVTRGNGTADGDQLGPTVVAEPRDLATTLEASGSLQRSDEYTVAYASALTSDGGDTQPDGSGGDGGDGGGDGGDGDSAQPAAFLTGPTSTSPSSSTTSSTTPTTDPCSPTSTSSTSTSSSSTTSTTRCPTTTSTTSTTTPTPSTTSTTAPTTSTTPVTQPRGGGGATSGGGTSSPSTGDAAARTGGSDGAGSGPGGAAPANGGDARPSGADGGGGGEVPSAILTSVLDVGATADRGTVLYTADEEPVVALIGDLPAWRTLEDGVDDGADIQQLEENLVALGYGDGLDVDETFTAETAAAVEAWETDLGRASPDGVVTIGDVVFLAAPGDVLGHEASVGDTLEAGSPVMTIGSEQRIVVADVDASEAAGWAPGSTVELEWADTTTSQGTVIGTGREISDGKVELTVAVGTGDSGAGERRSGAAADVTLVDARRDGVIAVPVAAIVDDGGSPGVRVAQPDGPDRIFPVETGLVADGWVEITTGLDGGEEIRLPA
jgi:Putative peptidoglycan binding domain